MTFAALLDLKRSVKSSLNDVLCAVLREDADLAEADLEEAEPNVRSRLSALGLFERRLEAAAERCPDCAERSAVAVVWLERVFTLVPAERFVDFAVFVAGFFAEGDLRACTAGPCCAGARRRDSLAFLGVEASADERELYLEPLDGMVTKAALSVRSFSYTQS